ncbi:MAG TPA: hypothetical protein VK966_07480 [Longimicrobiales bacterium]|nr:hypothetical protein [Longimicrobiales bacterium]
MASAAGGSIKALSGFGQFVRDFFSGYQEAKAQGLSDPESYFGEAGLKRLRDREASRGRSRIRAALTARPDLFSVLGSSQNGGL